MKQPIEKSLNTFLLVLLLLPGACNKQRMDPKSEIKATLPRDQKSGEDKDKNIFHKADQFLDGAKIAHCNGHEHNRFCFSSEIANSDLGSFTVSHSSWMIAKSDSQDGFAQYFSLQPYMGGIIFSVNIHLLGQPSNDTNNLIKTDLSLKLNTQILTDIRSQKPLTFSGNINVGRVWAGKLELHTVRSVIKSIPTEETFGMMNSHIIKEIQVPQLGPRTFHFYDLSGYLMKMKIHSYAKGQCQYRAYMYRDGSHPHVAGYITGIIEAPPMPEKGKRHPSDAYFSNMKTYEKYPPAPYVIEQWSKVFDKGDTTPCL